MKKGHVAIEFLGKNQGINSDSHVFDHMSSLQKPRVAILKLRGCYTNWVGIILEALIFGSRHEPTESINGTSKRWVLNHSGSIFFRDRSLPGTVNPKGVSSKRDPPQNSREIQVEGFFRHLVRCRVKVGLVIPLYPFIRPLKKGCLLLRCPRKLVKV